MKKKYAYNKENSPLSRESPYNKNDIKHRESHTVKKSDDIKIGNPHTIKKMTKIGNPHNKK